METFFWIFIIDCELHAIEWWLGLPWKAEEICWKYIWDQSCKVSFSFICCFCLIIQLLMVLYTGDYCMLFFSSNAHQAYFMFWFLGVCCCICCLLSYVNYFLSKKVTFSELETDMGYDILKYDAKTCWDFLDTLWWISYSSPNPIMLLPLISLWKDFVYWFGSELLTHSWTCHALVADTHACTTCMRIFLVSLRTGDYNQTSICFVVIAGCFPVVTLSTNCHM